MPTIAEYLEELNKQRNHLAKNLNTMGVQANATETLNTLVPKVLQIQHSGSETFYLTLIHLHQNRRRFPLMANQSIFTNPLQRKHFRNMQMSLKNGAEFQVQTTLSVTLRQSMVLQ